MPLMGSLDSILENTKYIKTSAMRKKITWTQGGTRPEEEEGLGADEGVSTSADATGVDFKYELLYEVGVL